MDFARTSVEGEQCSGLVQVWDALSLSTLWCPQHLQNRYLQSGKGWEGEGGPLFTKLIFQISPQDAYAANCLMRQIENG